MKGPEPELITGWTWMQDWLCTHRAPLPSRVGGKSPAGAGEGLALGQPAHWLAGDLWGEESQPGQSDAFPPEFNRRETQRVPGGSQRNQSHIKISQNLLTVSPHTPERMTFLNIE